MLKGFKDGGEVFSVTIDDTGGDVTWTNETSDGFTQVNLASLGHGNKLVDEIRLDFSGSTVAYAAFDEIVWSNSSVGDYNRENFETASDNASTFTNNSQSFTLTNSLKVQKNIGAIGVNESSGFLDNFDATPPIIADGGSPYSPSVQTTDGTDIFLRGLYVYMSNNGSYTPVHSVGITVKGYRDGSGTPVYSQVFSPTFDNDNKGFNFLDISDSNEVILIDRFEIVPANNTAGGANEIQYVAIDNLYWSLPSVTTPPTFENSTPSQSSVAQTSFTLGTDIDEAGHIYYVVVADGAGEPSSAQVKAGQNSAGGSPVTSGNAAVSTGGFTNNFSVTGLTAGTAYDVYVVAQDDEGTPNVQASATKIDVNTTTYPLTITANSGLSKVYGATDPTLTYTITGFVNGDVEGDLDTPVSISRASGENVANYVVTPASATDTNYSVSFVTTTFGITQAALTVTANSGLSKVYGATDPTLTYTITGFVNGDVEGDLDTPASISRASGENVANYVVTPADAADTNYSVSFVTTTFGITQAALTVTADSGLSKVYGATDPTLTYTITGFVGADNEASLDLSLIHI